MITVTPSPSPMKKANCENIKQAVLLLKGKESSKRHEAVAQAQKCNTNQPVTMGQTEFKISIVSYSSAGVQCLVWTRPAGNEQAPM